MTNRYLYLEIVTNVEVMKIIQKTETSLWPSMSR